jgi:triphosphoribosyl-dephospho-CoA synthase
MPSQPVLPTTMLARQDIQQAIRWACRQEVNSPKPGNVNCFSGGHNMQIADFLASADAIAEPLSNPALTVGQKILASVSATRQVVDCNTNLGIILLFAPLCKAIEQSHCFQDIQQQLTTVLNELTVADAVDCYQAIALAEAGGLGKVEQQDIYSKPTVTLRQAMALAESKDSIAKQYLNNYHEIYRYGLNSLTLAINYGETIEWAAAFAYLTILVNIPDSLIVRKQGLEQAVQVSKKAQTLMEKVSNINMLSGFESELMAWDKQLKQQAVNPGTSADITAATLLLYRFQQLLDC